VPYRRTSRPFRASRRPRRRMEWADTSATLLPVAGTSTLTDLLASLQSDLGSNPVDWTILRIIGTLELGGATQVARCGIRVATEQEDAADVLPQTFPHQDWMYNVRLSAPSVDHLSSAIASRPFDLRGRRRLKTVSDTLVFAAEQVAGTPSLALHTRVLVALP